MRDSNTGCSRQKNRACAFLRRLALLASVLQVTGCALFGVRLLDESWEPANVQTAYGMHAPLGSPMMSSADASPFFYPFESLISTTSSGGFVSRIEETSIGIAYSLAGSQSLFDNRPWIYAGVGLSLIQGEFSDGVLEEKGSALGGYVHCGVWRVQGGVIGVEVRYSFGASMDLLGAERSADGLQLALAVMFAN